METDRVILTPLSQEDSPLLWQWINTRALVTQSSTYRPVHAGSHEEWFAGIQKRPDSVVFAIRLLADNKLIGTCQLHSIQPVHRCAELQIRIGLVECRGKGYGAQALQQLLEFGFRDLNLNRIHLHVLADNQAARRLYARHGFQQEGCLRSAAFIDGRYQDILIMALLRDEYHATSGAAA